MVTYGINKMLADANAVIEAISVEDAHSLIDNQSIVFVDVRETVERQQGGTIRGAIHAPRGFLEIGYPLRSRDVNMLGWRTRHPIPKAGSTTRAP